MANAFVIITFPKDYGLSIEKGIIEEALKKAWCKLSDKHKASDVTGYVEKDAVHSSSMIRIEIHYTVGNPLEIHFSDDDLKSCLWQEISQILNTSLVSVTTYTSRDIQWFADDKTSDRYQEGYDAGCKHGYSEGWSSGMRNAFHPKRTNSA